MAAMTGTPTAGQQYGSYMQAGGNILSAFGNLQSGQSTQAGDAYKAQQDLINAGQTVAAGSADMASQIMQTKLLQSRAVAVAGASGAGALDPTVVNIVSQIANTGAYNTAMTNYNAQSRANALTNQAAAENYMGNQASQASKWAAGGNILSAGATLAAFA